MSLLSAKNKLNKKASDPGDEDDFEYLIGRVNEKKEVLNDFRKLSKEDFKKKYTGKFTQDYLNKYYYDETAEYDNKPEKLWEAFRDLNRTEDPEYYFDQSINYYKNHMGYRDQNVKAASDYLNNYISNYKKKKELEGIISSKYGDVNNLFTVDKARESYNKGIVEEALRRIKTLDDIKVPGNDPSKMTCISGTCTLAANQGVKFDKVPGNKDKLGRNIPYNNATFYKHLKDSGYEEIPLDKMAPGDFVQYDYIDDKIPGHMELVLQGPKGYNTAVDLFNNYSLTNDKGKLGITPGRNDRYFRFGPDGKLKAYDYPKINETNLNARVLRIKDDAVIDAYLNKNPDIAPEIRRQLELAKSYPSSKEKMDLEAATKIVNSKNPNVLYSDSRYFDDIISGVTDTYKNDPEGLKKYLRSKGLKSPMFISNIVDNLYSQQLQSQQPNPVTVPTAPVRMTAN